MSNPHSARSRFLWKACFICLMNHCKGNHAIVTTPVAHVNPSCKIIRMLAALGTRGVVDQICLHMHMHVLLVGISQVCIHLLLVQMCSNHLCRQHCCPSFCRALPFLSHSSLRTISAEGSLQDAVFGTAQGRACRPVLMLIRIGASRR